MPIEVTMPKLSPTMESGVIAQWLVKIGDTIKEGDVLEAFTKEEIQII